MSFSCCERAPLSSLSWQSAAGAPSEVPFHINLGAGKPDSPAAFEAVAETKDLQALLTLRYRAAGLISANDTAACAFIPLERGVLQMPLPGPADKKPDQTKEDVPRRCFTGLVFARFETPRVEESSDLDSTGRGAGGFGSTGRG